MFLEFKICLLVLSASSYALLSLKSDSLLCVPIIANGGIIFGVSIFALYLMTILRGTMTCVTVALLKFTCDVFVSVTAEFLESSSDAVDTVDASLLSLLLTSDA